MTSPSTPLASTSSSFAEPPALPLPVTSRAERETRPKERKEICRRVEAGQKTTKPVKVRFLVAASKPLQADAAQAARPPPAFDWSVVHALRNVKARDVEAEAGSSSSSGEATAADVAAQFTTKTALPVVPTPSPAPTRPFATSSTPASLVEWLKSAEPALDDHAKADARQAAALRRALQSRKRQMNEKPRLARREEPERLQQGAVAFAPIPRVVIEEAQGTTVEENDEDAHLRYVTLRPSMAKRAEAQRRVSEPTRAPTFDWASLTEASKGEDGRGGGTKATVDGDIESADEVDRSHVRPQNLRRLSEVLRAKKVASQMPTTTNDDATGPVETTSKPVSGPRFTFKL